MKHNCLFVILLFFVATSVEAQLKHDNSFEKILRKNSDSVFIKVLDNPQKYRLQIVYTEINRDKNNSPTFKNYYFNVNKQQYFYPASAVKLPVAILTLEKLNNIAIEGLNKYTTMLTDSACCEQTKQYNDPSAKSKLPSVAHYIKETLLVSENNAYNRLYEFFGQEYINQALRNKGYSDTQITHRFIPLSQEQNRNTNPIRFVDNEGKSIYSQPSLRSNLEFDFTNKILIGKGYYDWGGKLINEPMDFTYRNRMSLENLHGIVRSVVFPLSLSKEKRFNLTDEDYSFIRQYMSQFPGETSYPKYDAESYYDSYVKYFFDDMKSKRLPKSLRVFNKVGWSYGFLTDASYVADFENNIEFMLSATIYTNEDGIFNDDVYEYDTIARPFLYQLGQTIYQYELKRDRKYMPDLSNFKIDYETQRIDNEPTIKEAEN